MVSDAHLHDYMDLHNATAHRTVEERLAACEAALAEHGGRMDGLDAALAVHAAEPVEVTYVDVDESPNAEVDVAEAGDAAQADIAESESGDAETESGAA